MKNWKERQLNLIQTLEVQTASYKQEAMMEFIRNKVSKIPNCTLSEDNGNIYVVRGEAKTYPCVVSHMDTVHSIYPKSRVFNYNGKLFSINYHNMNRIGTGGDDKVGVFVCLQALAHFENIKVAFFRDEEVGCRGSSVADMDFFEDVSFVLQCDRKGYRDFVDSIYGTKLYNDKFSKALQPLLKKWGKRETSGGLTDVYQLAENGLKVCTANMSCGYHEPHTSNEYVVVQETMDTLEFVLEVIQKLHKDGEKWEFEPDVWSQYNRHYDIYDYMGYGSRGKRKDYAYNTNSRVKDKDVKWIGGEDEDVEDDEPVMEEPCPSCGQIESVYYDPTEGENYCYNCQGYFSELQAMVDELESAEDVTKLLPPHTD